MSKTNMVPFIQEVVDLFNPQTPAEIALCAFLLGDSAWSRVRAARDTSFGKDVGPERFYKIELLMEQAKEKYLESVKKMRSR